VATVSEHVRTATIAHKGNQSSTLSQRYSNPEHGGPRCVTEGGGAPVYTFFPFYVVMPNLVAPCQTVFNQRLVKIL